MNAPYIPSQSLLEGKPYTPADKTDTHGILARWLASHNAPDTAESYQRDAITEHASMQVRQYERK